MKPSLIIWLLLAALFLVSVALTGTLHNQAAIRRSVEQCAKGSGWLSDAECRMMCTGRVK